MSDNPLSHTARLLMAAARTDRRGAKLKGRDQKAAAREVVRRGFGEINKSVTRLKLKPAGVFVLKQGETT
ncbi:hypothetical protein [Mameliella alba]|uniref:Uncharacterized protein n=1 Tax=Mameliella alba TaxID=561184 RepID=A0A0B3S0Z4_9RHOB|nr:hypothetical protein [Mameliella alba]KHQ50286.1 hypothetical protein OA50_05134 [Mameliella alba]